MRAYAPEVDEAVRCNRASGSCALANALREVRRCARERAAPNPGSSEATFSVRIVRSPDRRTGGPCQAPPAIASWESTNQAYR
jgi:hypothetical protein